MERGAGADRVDEIRDVQDGHVVVGMRIEAVSGLRGEGLLHDFALDVVHGVAVAVHDHAARGAEDAVPRSRPYIVRPLQLWPCQMMVLPPANSKQASWVSGNSQSSSK